MTPIERVLALLQDVHQSGDGWKATCPVHAGGKEREPSLSVCVGGRGQVLFNCHACGATAEEIASAIGLAMRELFDDQQDTTPEASRRAGSGLIISGNGKSSVMSEKRPVRDVTLSSLAEKVGLPVKFLAELGLNDFTLRDGGGRCVLVPYMDEEGKKLHSKMRMSISGRPKYVYKTGTTAVPYGLWKLQSVRSTSKSLVLVEGESDVWTLWFAGIPALGIPGAMSPRTLGASHLRGIEQLFIVREPGDAGDKFVAKVSARLSEIGWSGKCMRVDFDHSCKDPNELFRRDPEKFGESMRQLCRRAPSLMDTTINLDDLFIDLESIQEGRVSFLWEPYIPAGEMTILMGKPGQGKGQISRYLASCISTGSAMPGAEPAEPGNVVLFAPEDRASKVIKPSLRASGADFKRIKAFNFNGPAGTKGFTFEKMDLLERIADQFNPRLIIFDPIVSFMGERIDTNKAADVRSRLNPLSLFAEERGIALLLIGHMNKGSSVDVLNRLYGSVDFGAIVRSAIAIDRDPHTERSEGSSYGVLAHVKYNLSPQGRSLKFEIFNSEGNVPCVRWIGQHDMSAEEIMDTNQESGSKMKDARSLIAGLLHDGQEMEASTIYRLVGSQGISSTTADRAARALGYVDRRRVGYGPGSKIVWFRLQPGEKPGSREQKKGYDSDPDEEPPF